MNAETFNALYEVGIPVFAYPGARPEGFPSARRLVTRTRSKAMVLSGHTDVVWVDGHSACIALSHVDVVTEDEYKAAVEGQGALPVPAGSPAQDDELRSRVAELEKVRAEIARFGIYGTAVAATKALVKRAGQLVTENAELRGRLRELERPAIEAKRNEIRDSFAELAAAARETRDYEGAFSIECDLRDREEQWKREDEAAARADETARPSTTEFAVRLPSGSVVRTGNPTSRPEQEGRLARYVGDFPAARLVQRTVHYGEWTEADR